MVIDKKPDKFKEQGMTYLLRVSLLVLKYVSFLHCRAFFCGSVYWTGFPFAQTAFIVVSNTIHISMSYQLHLF